MELRYFIVKVGVCLLFFLLLLQSCSRYAPQPSDSKSKKDEYSKILQSQAYWTAVAMEDSEGNPIPDHEFLGRTYLFLEGGRSFDKENKLFQWSCSDDGDTFTIKDSGGEMEFGVLSLGPDTFVLEDRGNAGTEPIKRITYSSLRKNFGTEGEQRITMSKEQIDAMKEKEKQLREDLDNAIKKLEEGDLQERIAEQEVKDQLEKLKKRLREESESAKKNLEDLATSYEEYKKKHPDLSEEQKQREKLKIEGRFHRALREQKARELAHYFLTEGPWVEEGGSGQSLYFSFGYSGGLLCSYFRGPKGSSSSLLDDAFSGNFGKDYPCNIGFFPPNLMTLHIRGKDVYSDLFIAWKEGQGGFGLYKGGHHDRQMRFKSGKASGQTKKTEGENGKSWYMFGGWSPLR